MAAAADVDNLGVVTPAGEHGRFDLEMETLQAGGRTTARIRRLVRHVPA